MRPRIYYADADAKPYTIKLGYSDRRLLAILQKDRQQPGSMVIRDLIRQAAKKAKGKRIVPGEV